MDKCRNFAHEIEISINYDYEEKKCIDRIGTLCSCE